MSNHYKMLSMIVIIVMLIGNMATQEVQGSGEELQNNSTWNPTANYTWTPSPIPSYNYTMYPTTNYTWTPSPVPSYNYTTYPTTNYTWTPSPIPNYNYTMYPTTNYTWTPSPTPSYNYTMYPSSSNVSTNIPHSYAPSGFPTTVSSPMRDEFKIVTGVAVGVSALGLGLLVFARYRRSSGNNQQMQSENKNDQQVIDARSTNGKPIIASSLTGMSASMADIERHPTAIIVVGAPEIGNQLNIKA